METSQIAAVRSQQAFRLCGRGPWLLQQFSQNRKPLLHYKTFGIFQKLSWAISVADLFSAHSINLRRVAKGWCKKLARKMQGPVRSLRYGIPNTNPLGGIGGKEIIVLLPQGRLFWCNCFPTKGFFCSKKPGSRWKPQDSHAAPETDSMSASCSSTQIFSGTELIIDRKSWTRQKMGRFGTESEWAFLNTSAEQHFGWEWKIMKEAFQLSLGPSKLWKTLSSPGP